MVANFVAINENYSAQQKIICFSKS